MPQEANQAARRTLPAWLDGRTIAIIATVLTVGICLGAMVHWSTEAVRAEIRGLHASIEDMRTELTTKLEAWRREAGNRIEHLRREVCVKIDGLDARLHVVEQSREAARGPALAGPRTRTRSACAAAGGAPKLALVAELRTAQPVCGIPFDDFVQSGL